MSKADSLPAPGLTVSPASDPPKTAGNCAAAHVEDLGVTPHAAGHSHLGAATAPGKGPDQAGGQCRKEAAAGHQAAGPQADCQLHVWLPWVQQQPLLC